MLGFCPRAAGPFAQSVGLGESHVVQENSVLVGQ